MPRKSSRGNIDPEEQRKKLFRKMEWTFVYGPPMLASCIGIVGGFVLALVIPVPGTTLLVRWLAAVLVLLVIPGAVFVVRERLGAGEE